MVQGGCVGLVCQLGSGGVRAPLSGVRAPRSSHPTWAGWALLPPPGPSGYCSPRGRRGALLRGQPSSTSGGSGQVRSPSPCAWKAAW